MKERGCGEILNELYCKWDSPDDIDLSVLPNSFVMKINNGSGNILIVSDKSVISESDVKEYFRKLYSNQFFSKNQELFFEFLGRNFFLKILDT